MSSKLRILLIALAFFVMHLGSSHCIYAAPQASGCSMLTPAQIQNVLGHPFGSPTETKAPPAYAKQSWGSNCRYSAQNGAHMTVTFIVYVDSSPTEAKQTFDKLSVWYTPKSRPIVGDSAYMDAHGAIHVLKGKVRYFLYIDPESEKHVKDLAASIAGRI